MKTISLTQGKVAIVDAADYAFVNGFKWYAQKHGNTYYAYKSVRIPKRGVIAMHRFILNPPNNMLTDHINRNGLDNRRSNLRPCDPVQNNRHKTIKSNNKTGFKGVLIDKRLPHRPYYGRIRFNGKLIYLGYCSTAQAAAQAYDLAAIKYFGEFALTNEILGLLPKRPTPKAAIQQRESVTV